MTEEDKAEVRRIALPILREYRDGGCKLLIKTLVWSSPAIQHSWYKNAHGDIHILSPWRLVDYWTWTREPNLSDFEIQ